MFTDYNIEADRLYLAITNSREAGSALKEIEPMVEQFKKVQPKQLDYSNVSFGYTLLHVAILNKDVEFIRYLIEKGASPGAQTHRCHNSIHFILNNYRHKEWDAEKQEQFDLVKLIIDKIDVKSLENTTAGYGALKETPLHMAAKISIPLFALLLPKAQQETLFIKNGNQETPLDILKTSHPIEFLSSDKDLQTELTRLKINDSDLYRADQVISKNSP